MSSLLDGVDMRTQLVGQNRLELLMFYLYGKQRYGINVFKVQEVIRRPALTRIPNSHPSVCGVATMRGKTIPVIDISKAMGMEPMDAEVAGNVIITEYNRTVQGFLVRAVDRILNIKWEEVFPPPAGAGRGSYLTAVTRVEEELVEIIDVEKVLVEISEQNIIVSNNIMGTLGKDASNHKPLVLLADDSAVARLQVIKTLEQIGVEVHVCKDGREALNTLKQWVHDHDSRLARIQVVISDVEMPEMDGYTLTTEIKKEDALKHLYVILHTSLSGIFNEALVKRVGADKFVPKFSADELAQSVLDKISEESRHNKHAA